MRRNVPPGGGGPAGPDPDPVPGPQAIPKQVTRPDNGTIYGVTDSPGSTKVPADQVLTQSAETFKSKAIQGLLDVDFNNAFRIMVECALMMVGCPPTIRMLVHSANADTLLLPAIKALLDKAAAIQSQEPRAFNEVDLDQMTLHQNLLPLYRELWQIFVLGAHCLEAGVTHLEQSLDRAARTVYPHVVDLMAVDFDMGQKLNKLSLLVAGPAQMGQETRRANERKAEGAVPCQGARTTSVVSA